MKLNDFLILLVVIAINLICAVNLFAVSEECVAVPDQTFAEVVTLEGSAVYQGTRVHTFVFNKISANIKKQTMCLLKKRLKEFDSNSNMVIQVFFKENEFLFQFIAFQKADMLLDIEYSLDKDKKKYTVTTTTLAPLQEFVEGAKEDRNIKGITILGKTYLSIPRDMVPMLLNLLTNEKYGK